ncbi:MAG: methyltransferase domain-containing protein [Phycisphaerales bacterium]
MSSGEQRHGAGGEAGVRSAGEVRANYRYWREHGHEWAAEYDERKTYQILYHIQEWMLTEYVRRHAAGRERPLRVLEYGCGVGRHLKNLHRIEGVEVFGYDQSASMAGSIVAWGGEKFFSERVRVGSPTPELAYEDGSFDLVYTAEVLVHVSPEDVSGILRELVRVCRGHVLHLEPGPEYALEAGCHDGCWNHDLPGLYSGMGRACETLERGYAAHTPYRVTVGEGARFTWSSQDLALWRRAEKDIGAGFAAMRARVAEEQAGRARESGELRERLVGAESRVSVMEGELRGVREALAAREAELGRMSEELAKRGEVLARREGELEESRRGAAANLEQFERERHELQEMLGAARRECADVLARASALEGEAGTLRRVMATQSEEHAIREAKLSADLGLAAARARQIEADRERIVARLKVHLDASSKG